MLWKKINFLIFKYCPMQLSMPLTSTLLLEMLLDILNSLILQKNSIIVKNLFKNNLAELNCKTVKKINIGDHLFFVAKVLQFKLKKEKKPLIYFSSKYKKLFG